MKRIAVALSVLTVLVLAAPAGAELCEKCKGKMYIMSVGKCVECGEPTGSGAFKLCPKCSAKLGQCEHCRAPLKAAKPAPVKPVTLADRINTKKSGTYGAGKWKYEYQILAKGSRSERRYGRLFYDGKEVPEPKGINDHYKTPWGRLHWVGKPPSRWGIHGWMPPGLTTANIMGRPLPAPEKSAPARLRALELDASSNGKTVSAVVGQKIIIRLKSNPTTGYSWLVGKIEGDALRQVGKVKYEQRKHAPGMVGVGGKEVLTFRTTKAGTAKLMLEYKGPGKKIARTFTLTLNVKPAPAKHSAPYLRALELDDSANGKTVSAVVGQKIIIRLKGAPVPGLMWGPAKLEGDAIEQVGQMKFVPDARPQPVFVPGPGHQQPGPVPVPGARPRPMPGRGLVAHTMGGPGKYVFTFRAVKAGKVEVTIKGRMHRPGRPARAFALTVDVKADPAKHSASYLRPLELDDSHKGKTVSAVVGQKIVIRLKGNPTTGYSWVAGKIEGDALGQVGKVKYVSDQPPAPAGGRDRRIMHHRVGGGGKYVFTFTAKKPGKAKLMLEYKRGWEKNKPPARTFTLTVSVKADPTAERVKKLKANLDSFTLTLRYHGPQNELLYRSLVLSVLQALVDAVPGNDYVIISKKQAEKIIEHLAKDGFLYRATTPASAKVGLPPGQLYAIEVHSGKIRLWDSLGWDLKMLKRLDGLRKVLDGDAAKAMDKLLKGLEPQRKEWEKSASVQHIVNLLINKEITWKDWCVAASRQPFEVRRQIINEFGLGRLRGHKELKQPVLLHFLRNDPVSNMRSAAAAGMRAVDGKSTEALLAASKDKADNVRLFACQSLGYAKPRPKVDLSTIKKALLQRVDDENLWVARVAVQSLGRLKHRPAVVRIVRFFHDHPADKRVAWTCAEALALLGEQEVVFEAAHVALGSKNRNIRYFTLRAMKNVSSSKVVPFLTEHLADEMGFVVSDSKEHGIYPRSFLRMAEQLEDRTGRRFGCEVDRWVTWMETGPHNFPRPERGKIRNAGQQLQSEFYRIWEHVWPRGAPGWDSAVKTIKGQKGSYMVRNLQELCRAISVLRRHARFTPPKQTNKLKQCVVILKGLVRHRDEWKVQADPPMGIAPPDVILEKTIRDAIRYFDAIFTADRVEYQASGEQWSSVSPFATVPTHSSAPFQQ